ncbi:gluconokinase [Xenorhabdus szentirmaii]|uniref:Gluconokinase n=2 Tax=Xenorhabdus szentirmaii TaxID=290112 RepID=W1IUJ3_9GAMM|nr:MULTISPECIES: gluconokinase [Xenorhabdus]MBD2780954.1 gluconokinase [Xenorhabdus sp. 38]MBD2792521.1 gluconokinase [Xenorhabdus sp. CUL]MBD2801694.1 gluconokinase [Xenorhabdus sp. M]MBD2805036.1 gluconokinase [Xenorhabdus sp. ZM]MBD2819234.1 gluconokinase [Xenorhabdus sp. 42]
MSDTRQLNHVFVLMGVSGSGKSAVACSVARQLGAAFLDGDFLHPRANIIKMAQGHALDDNDRQPWLKALNDAIFAMQGTNHISLLVCSALKKSYRDILREDNEHLSFLYMKGDFDLIEHRLKSRKGHFFKPQMLISQFNTLEEPGCDEKDVHHIDIKPTLGEVVKHTIQSIDCIIKTTAYVSEV